MKTTSLYIVLLAAAASLSACSDMLDKAPNGEFTAEQIDDSAVEGLMTSAYSGLEAHFLGNNESFTAPISNWVFDVRSDDAYKGGGGVTMEQSIHQLEISNFTSDNATNLNKWRNGYYAIARVHKSMKAVEASSLADKEPLLAELALLRAYFYFDLIRVFERIPYFDENADPNAARADQYTRDEIYSFIKADCERAWRALPEKQDAAGRFNKYVAAALMAKVCAQTHDWQQTVQYADYAMQGPYSLYDNFLDLSKIEFNNQKESIMAVQFSTATGNGTDRAHCNWGNLLNVTFSGQGEGGSGAQIGGGGDDFFLASQNLVNAFRTDANGLPLLDDFNSEDVTGSYAGNVDPRLDFTVGRIGFPFRGLNYDMTWTRAYNVYGEYSGKKGIIDPASPDMLQGELPWAGSGLNFILIRLADIMLLKAEALVEIGNDLETARQLVNQVREKAKRSIDPNYTPRDLNPIKAHYRVEPYPSTGWNQDYARKAVRMERRLELAMEGQRWFDLQRYGNTVSVMNEYFNAEKTKREYLNDANMSDNELFLPIPISEVQNAGGLYNN